MEFQNHDVLNDEASREFLKGRGIKALPVTIVDDEKVVIGYYPRKLVEVLELETAVDLASSAQWLAEKYEAILSAASRTAGQLMPVELDEAPAWRPRTLRELLLHIISFPELAWRAHEHGSMSKEDMEASHEKTSQIKSPKQIAEYGHEVSENVTAFLKSGNTSGFERVVPAHYGGEVTVLELLHIILRHSTHHLKQVYHIMETDLKIKPEKPASAADFEGISTPEELI